MLYQVATGAGISAGGATVPPFTGASAPPAAIPAGEGVGAIGGVGFRTGSLPIIVWMTDACSHQSEVGGAYGYAFAGPASSTSALAALAGIAARVIAVVSDPQTTGCGAGDARLHTRAAVDQTGARVPPGAWGPAGTRPPACAPGQCCTGIDGAGEAADGAGQCPLLFRLNGNTGSGLGNAVATAVEVLTSFGSLDIGADPQDDPSDAVDAVAAFVARVEANASAASPCASGLTAVDTSGDGVSDTFDAVTPGTRVCFDVVPKMNTTVQPLPTPQMFRATVVVAGDGVTTLDTRDVFFLVPPVIPNEPVD
jgi:hypothetical protein